MQRHDALFRAFTEHAHLPSVEIDVLKQQTRCFRDTSAACVQELENRAIAHVGGLIAAAPHRKQTRHVGGRNSSRKAASELRSAHDIGGIRLDQAFSHKPPKK